VNRILIFNFIANLFPLFLELEALVRILLTPLLLSLSSFSIGRCRRECSLCNSIRWCIVESLHCSECKLSL